MGGGKYAFTYSAILIRSPDISLIVKNSVLLFTLNLPSLLKNPCRAEITMSYSQANKMTKNLPDI